LLACVRCGRRCVPDLVRPLIRPDPFSRFRCPSRRVSSLANHFWQKSGSMNDRKDKDPLGLEAVDQTITDTIRSRSVSSSHSGTVRPDRGKSASNVAVEKTVSATMLAYLGESLAM